MDIYNLICDLVKKRMSRKAGYGTPQQRKNERKNKEINRRDKGERK